MKTSIKALLAVAAFGASALFVQAQPALKVATVDLNKALAGYYRTQEEDARLQAYQQTANKDFEKILNEGKEMATRLQSQAESLKNPVLSEDARKRAQEDVQRLSQDMQKKEQELNEYRQTALRNIQQGVATTRQLLVEEITKVATEIGKKKGATLIIERNAFVFGDAAYDLTDEVVAELNKNKPATTAAPAVSFPAK